MKKFLLLFCMFFGLFWCQHTSHPQTPSETTIPQNAVFVDVRTQAEWDAGHVQNAIHVPLSDIESGKNLDKIPKNMPVYLYCRSGNRSGQAIKILEKHGFDNLINAWWMDSLQNVTIVK